MTTPQPSSHTPATAALALQTARIITLALTGSVVGFAIIVLAVLRAGKPLAPEAWGLSGMLTLLALLFAVMNIALSFVVPPQLTRTGLQRVTRDQARDPKPGWEGFPVEAPAVFPVFQSELIVRLALLEGAAFFAVIAHMMEGTLLPLLAALVLVILMLASFPTDERFRAWVESART